MAEESRAMWPGYWRLFIKREDYRGRDECRETIDYLVSQGWSIGETTQELAEPNGHVWTTMVKKKEGA